MPMNQCLELGLMSWKQQGLLQHPLRNFGFRAGKDYEAENTDMHVQVKRISQLLEEENRTFDQMRSCPRRSISSALLSSPLMAS